MKRRIILAGGSGFIGQSISPLFLAKNYEVVVLTRRRSHGEGAIRHVQWDGRKIDKWIEELDGAFAIVNLTGRSINCRHTPGNQRAIIASRVDSVRVLGEAIADCAQPPKVFVQAAGAGIYGDKGERWCDENTAHGDDFVTKVCEAWESAFEQIDSRGARRVLLRLGVVLGREGGFLNVLGNLTRAFLGGQVGDGRQFISWIHLADLAGLFLRAIEHDEVAGIYNTTSPNPVTNAKFMHELRHVLHRPWSPPVPKFAARIGSWLIGSEADLAFVSQRCTPKRLLENGFNFQFAELPVALGNIYSDS